MQKYSPYVPYLRKASLKNKKSQKYVCLIQLSFFFYIRVNYFLSLESTPEKISFEVTKRRMTSQKCSLFVISGLGKYELKRNTESSPSHDERFFMKIIFYCQL